MRQVVAILVSLVLGAVATAQEPRPPRVDLSVFAGTYDLDEVEYDFDNGPAATEDRTLERDRAGARFAFGPEHVRGFFQFFNEQVDFRLAPGSAF
jgi:hypothetical protein